MQTQHVIWFKKKTIISNNLAKCAKFYHQRGKCYHQTQQQAVKSNSLSNWRRLNISAKYTVNGWKEPIHLARFNKFNGQKYESN